MLMLDLMRAYGELSTILEHMEKLNREADTPNDATAHLLDIAQWARITSLAAIELIEDFPGIGSVAQCDLPPVLGALEHGLERQQTSLTMYKLRRRLDAQVLS